jgi:hypothetical protein
MAIIIQVILIFRYYYLIQVIVASAYALFRFHTRSFILRSHVRLMRIECASNTVNAFTRTCTSKGTVYLSSELFPFFCMYSVLLFYYIRPSSIINSPRFHAYCYLPSFCLSHASPGSHFFSFVDPMLRSRRRNGCVSLLRQPVIPTARYSDGPLFWRPIIPTAHYSVTFPIPGRSIIIALSGDVQPRIKAPFPFQNFLSRPWYVKISLTDGPS